MVGMATAGSFPPAVLAAAQGNPLYFLLGGIAALLPDTLDFKLLRYGYRHDAEVVPDPLAPDMQMVAEALAGAIDAAALKKRPFRIRLHTIRLAADRWQRYRLFFDPAKNQITATLTDITDTGGNPEPESAKKTQAGMARFNAMLRLEYTASINVDIFDGPHFEMIPEPDGTVTAAFIPWHRKCTHSLAGGILIALPAGLIWGILAAAVTFCAHLSHILLDQLGFMGCNLGWPFSRRRSPGLKMQRSDGPLTNLAAVWMSALWIFVQASVHSHGLSSPFQPVRLLLTAGIIPLCIIGWIQRMTNRPQRKQSGAASQKVLQEVLLAEQ